MSPELRRQALRYGAVGLLSAAGYVAVVTVLVEWLDVDPVVAASIGFLAVLGYSFVLNHRWTFDGHSVSARTGAMRYAIVSTFGFCLNAGTMATIVQVFDLPYGFGQAAATVLVPVMNFVLNRAWTWGRPATS